MEFEFVGNTHTTAYQDLLETDDFFKRYAEKNKRLRVKDWKGGILYSSPGNVLGIILANEIDTSEWRISLLWTNQKKGDTLCVYKKGDDDRFWCIQNDYLEHISELTSKKELTIKFHSHNQLGIIEYARWVFLIAPTYMEEEYLKHWDNIDLREVTSTSLDDLW